MIVISMDATSKRAGMDACKLCLLRKREIWERGAHKVNRAATRSQNRKERETERKKWSPIHYPCPFSLKRMKRKPLSHPSAAPISRTTSSVGPSCSSTRREDQINIDQPSVGTPSLQTFGNTVVRSRHPPDSEVHDTRSHRHHTRPDRQLHQGPVADLSPPKPSLWSRRRTPNPLSVHAS